MRTLYHEPDDLLSQPMTMKQPEVEPHRKSSFWGGDKTETETTVKNSVINSARKLLQKATCEVIANNSQVFQQITLAQNFLDFTDISCGGDANFLNLGQGNNITTDTTISMEQTTIVSINRDMATSVSDSFKDKDTTAGTSAGEVTGQLADTVSTLMGSDVSRATNLEENIMKACNDNVSQTINDNMNLENLQSAVEKAQASNRIAIRNIQCGGNLNVKNVAQENVMISLVDATMTSIFNANICSQMVTNIESDVTKEVEKFGDIVAGGMAAKLVGEALAQNITAAGEAAEDVGSGIAKAITPVTEMAEEVSEDANDTAQTAILSMILPLIVFIIVAGIVMSQMGAESNA